MINKIQGNGLFGRPESILNREIFVFCLNISSVRGSEGGGRGKSQTIGDHDVNRIVDIFNMTDRKVSL